MFSTQDAISVAFLVDFLLRWWSRGLKSGFLLTLPMVLDFLSFLPFLLNNFVPALAGVEPHLHAPPTCTG